jgi:Calcineurin-like phosphoesterase
VITTALLLIMVLALVWYGSTYLLRPPAAVFSRAPYLTRVTTTAADFAWELKDPGPAVELNVLAPDGSETTAASGRLDGLHPGTRYLWSANIDGRSAAAGAFTTAPLSTGTPITLVSFGDYGSGNAHEYAVGRLAAAADPALFLSAGDNAYLLAAPPFLNRAIFAPLRDLLGEAPMVAALGEHDLAYRDGSAVISALHLPGHQYSVQYGPVQVVVLGLEADASALTYASHTLGRCRGPCPVRFVLTHRPISADNPIMPLLRRRHVAAILAGHLHRYERHVRAGVLQFTIGTGGEGPGNEANTLATPDAQVSFLAYGFLRIGIDGDRISYWFVDERGRIRDRVERSIQP